MITPFSIFDIRQKIMKHRREEMKKDYIRKIYKSWTKDDLGELYIITKDRKNQYINWSVLPVSIGNIDDTPLLITKYSNKPKELKTRFDTCNLINTSHIILYDWCKYWAYWDIDVNEHYYVGITDDYIQEYEQIELDKLNLELERRTDAIILQKSIRKELFQGFDAFIK